MASGGLQFKAFVSYSHRDKAAAAWLHRGLEAYRVPKHLVGRETDAGLVTARVGKVFRDRDELAVSADLSGEINEALKATQFLVVLCSPASAQSEWVNQEIINFKRLKGEGSIICVIVDGDPFASFKPNQEGKECFAPALRFHLKEDGTVSDQPAEPIAADMRPHADGKRLAKLKVIAGLLGVGLDELVQRENQRRQRRLAALTAASVAGMLVMSGLTWNAIQSQSLAEERRAEAEDLVEFMIGDLRHPMEEVGRTDVLVQVIERVISYYQSQDVGSLPDDSLGRWARTLHLDAQSKLLLGMADDAMVSADDAHAVTSELVERSPQDVDRLDEHGQSKFWLGQLEYTAEEYQKAALSMRLYSEIAEQVAAEKPGDADYAKTAGRAVYSYAAVLLQLDQTSEALMVLDKAVPYFKALLSVEDEEEGAIEDIAYINSWRSDAYVQLNQLEIAVEYQAKVIDGFAKLHAAYPDDKDLEFPLAEALRKSASMYLSMGEYDMAQSHFDAAECRLERLLNHDESNAYWQEESELLQAEKDRLGAAYESGEVIKEPAQKTCL